MIEKTCTGCRQSKLLSEFPKNKRQKDGHHYRCKKCNAVSASANYKANRTERLKMRRLYRITNRDNIKEKLGEWYQLNRINVKTRVKLYREKNRDKVTQTNLKYRRRSRQRMLEHSFSNMIRVALKGNKNGRSWETLVGYTLADLREHLEAQFVEDMNWENYGYSSGAEKWWTVDHKKPRSSYVYESPADPEFLECWALSNLQPMWFSDNFSKCNRRDDSIVIKVDRKLAITMYAVEQKSVAAIAKYFNVSIQYISRLLKENGIAVNPTPQRKVIDADIAARYRSGEKPNSIAKAIGVRPALVYDALKRAGIILRINPHKVIIPPDELTKLYCEYRVSMTEIGSIYNTDKKTVARNVDDLGLDRNERYYTSGPELAIRRHLEKLGFHPRKENIGSYLELDIIIPERRLAIEYCGLYWHSERTKTKTYHADKMKWCNERGIQLLTVFEDEWLSRRNVVLSIISAKLGVFQRKLMARKCIVEVLNQSEASEFLQQYHIQGTTAFNHAVGLRDEAGLLVEVMTFGRHHRQNQNGAVLSRLCSLPETCVVGGASKLLSAARPWIKERRLVSWSDNRWSDGKVYKLLGFSLEAELPPDYSYANSKQQRRSKQSFKKSNTGCPPEITEQQWALDLGWHRIWDCGKKRWILQT